jgi:ArsR family transcriptional regulator, repressor of sdpIR and other operons
MNTMFKALGDKTRREILEMLRKKDLTAGEIADAFHISKPSISHHLDILRQAKLIASVKEGQFMVYSLNTSEVDEIIKWLYKFSKKNNKQ